MNITPKRRFNQNENHVSAFPDDELGAVGRGMSPYG